MSRIERYRACAQRGMTVAATARLYRVTPSAVWHANRKHKLGFPTHGRKAPKRDLVACRKQLEALAAQGKTRREISVEMKAPFDTVVSWIKRWEVKIAQWPGSRKPMLEMIGHLITAQELEDLRLLKRNGYSYRDAFKAMRRPDLLAYLPEKAA